MRSETLPKFDRTRTGRPYAHGENLAAAFAALGYRFDNRNGCVTIMGPGDQSPRWLQEDEAIEIWRRMRREFGFKMTLEYFCVAVTSISFGTGETTGER